MSPHFPIIPRSNKFKNFSLNLTLIRMHSSRMRTARLLTVSRSIPCIGGGCLPNPALDIDPPGHVTCDACWEAKPRPTPPLWTEEMTHACENITLPQNLLAGGKYACDISRPQNQTTFSPPPPRMTKRYLIETERAG